MSTTTAVQKQSNDFLSMLQSKQTESQLAKILPPCLTVERFKRIVRTAWLNDPDLQTCEPASIMLAVMGLATLGLEPDRRKAHLIRFKGKAVGMVGYLGYITRAKENGLHGLHFDNVFFNDKFTWKQTGDGLQYEHEQDFRNPDRGEMFASYVIWKEAESEQLQGVIMPRLEIEKIRDASAYPGGNPWKIHFLEMCKKTVIRRAQKQWPLDAGLGEAVKSGKVLDAAAIDIDSEVVPENPPVDDPLPMDGKTPLAVSNAPAAGPAKETPRAAITNAMNEAGVPFDMFTAEITARNIAKDADSWASYTDVPDGVFDSLAAQPKTVAAMVKKHGKKQ